VTRGERWTAQAEAWSAWADARHEDDVLPMFQELLPRPPLRTLDLGCGEGRLTRELRARGHNTVGVDITPRLIELAQERDPEGDYRIARAERLPFADGAFELVVAFNVLMNVDEPEQAIAEAARVLADGGRLCGSIVHPLASAGTWDDDAFVVRDYPAERAYEDLVGSVVFANIHAPLELWSRRFENGGLAVERLREVPRAGMRGWDRLPMFLFLRAVKQ
jgi:SAM-dependent methyltransferase